MEYCSEISERGYKSTKTGLLGVEHRNKYKNYFLKLITFSEALPMCSVVLQILNYIDSWCTLPSEIVRTVLVSAIKNHCWLQTTISRWKIEVGHFLKNRWKAYEMPRLVMLNKYFPKIWKWYDIESKVLSLIKDKKT